jgi:hypothetical protein
MLTQDVEARLESASVEPLNLAGISTPSGERPASESRTSTAQADTTPQVVKTGTPEPGRESVSAKIKSNSVSPQQSGGKTSMTRQFIVVFMEK